MELEQNTDSDASECKQESSAKEKETAGSATRELESEHQRVDNDGSDINCGETGSRTVTATPASMETGTQTRSETSMSNTTGRSAKCNTEELQSKNLSSHSSSSARNKQTDTPMETSTHRVTFTVTISKAIPTGSRVFVIFL